MKVSVIISICDGREKHFARSLDTWKKQTLPKNDWELVIVDDGNRENIKELIFNEGYLYGLNIKYIQIDNSLADIPITTFLPILSNNVGVRMSLGDVVVFTGPETLQMERNLEVAATFSNRKECGYGLVYRSSAGFVDEIEERWDELKNASGDALLNIKGAKADCRTRPPHPPAYMYFCCVKKEYVEKIGGFDESYLQGIYAEDDDFAWRMNKSDVKCVFEHSIVGIHQDHSREDKKSEKHKVRSTARDKEMRAKNVDLFREKQRRGEIIANKDHIWGDKKVITAFGSWRY